MKVLLVAGHVGIEAISADHLRSWRDWRTLARGTGSAGEREWTGDAVQRVAASLRGRGVEAVVSDSIYRPGVSDGHYDFALVLHFMRDSDDSHGFAAPPEQGSGAWGGPFLTDAAYATARRWCDLFASSYERRTTIKATQDKVGIRMTQNYWWDYLEENTPAVLIECGHGDLDAAVLYEPAIARVAAALADITCEILGVVQVSPQPFPLASFPVPGVWDHEPEALEYAVQLVSGGAAPKGWAVLCAAHAKEIGVRADVAAAIAAHETGNWHYGGGDLFAVTPSMHNFGGIKNPAGTASAIFATDELGVMALLAHLAWYALPDHTVGWCDSAHDPRHFGAHRNSVHTLADFGHGNWNEGDTYGPNVARHLAEIRAAVAGYVPPTAPRPQDYLAEELRRVAAAVEAIP